MTFQPTSAQTLFMLRLVFGPPEPKLAEARPEFKPTALRDQLVSLGLIRLEKRGRAKHVVLTERGFSWVGDNLHQKINPIGRVPGEVLMELLPRLKSLIDRNQLVLSDLFAASTPAAPTPDEVETQLLQTLRSLDNGRHTRLLLADARAALPTLVPSAFDAAALALQSKGLVALYNLDDPSQRTSRVEQAAIQVAGSRYHLAYLT